MPGLNRDFIDFGRQRESDIRERFITLAMRNKLAPVHRINGCGVGIIDDPDGWVFFTDMAGNYLRFNDALGRLATAMSRQHTHDETAVQLSNMIHGILTYPPENRL